MTRIWVSLFVCALGIQAAQQPSMWTAVRGVSEQDQQTKREGRPSVRVQPSASLGEAIVRSAPMRLTVGKSYELRGWLRTEGVEVRDLDRTPIATGASLSMASMPWDVHSESLGGNTDWKRVHLKFVATRAEDQIEIRVAVGGGFRGVAWAEGVTLDEIAGSALNPPPGAVTTFGPAYRYPRRGWVYLHIEGKPYERGFQHGNLMAREIEGYIDRCAAVLNSKDRKHGWQTGRTVANAVFLRGFDDEILREMAGIADGAAAAGAKYDGRKVDLTDIVAVNTATEIGLLAPASEITPTGLEGLGLKPPDYASAGKDPAVTERCSAFAATGKATRDGRMVIGHVTWWSLTLAEQTNIMLDVKPTEGHRVLMQSFPGGIQSGTDWYQNDAGVVLTETTIRQSPFNIVGTPVAFRARKAIQYGGNVDEVVQHLTERNNGLYTNEWLIGDAKNNEIAMYELGTYRTKLWRSSKNEWFGGTEGFYWGCNNAKDLNVRLEYAPDPRGETQYLPYLSTPRDRKWVELYGKNKGEIDEQFAFTAFRTPPLVAASTMDAKVTDSEMASRMMVWALLGKPNEREWVPNDWQKQMYERNEGLYASGYHLFQANPVAPPAAPAAPAVKETIAAAPVLKQVPEEKLWKGWILPASEAEEWIAIGSAFYREALSSNSPSDEITAWRLRIGRSPQSTRIAEAVLQFEAARQRLGDEAFLKLMDEYFQSHTTKTVSAADLPFAHSTVNATADEKRALQSSVFPKLSDALVVYGTEEEAGANRYAAEVLQAELNGMFESRVPLRKDFELTPEQAKSKTLIFVGRPAANSALRAFVPALGLKFDGASFEVNGKSFVHGRDGLMWAGVHPENRDALILVLAGNSPVETVRLATLPLADKVWQVTRAGKSVESGF
jgi:hypothetical protein